MGGDIMKMLLSQYGGQGLSPLLGQLGGLPTTSQQPMMPTNGLLAPLAQQASMVTPMAMGVRPSPRDQFYTRLAALQAQQAAGKKK